MRSEARLENLEAKKRCCFAGGFPLVPSFTRSGGISFFWGNKMRLLIENGSDGRFITTYVNQVDAISICSFDLERGTSSGDVVSVSSGAVQELIKELEAVCASLRADVVGDDE